MDPNDYPTVRTQVLIITLVFVAFMSAWLADTNTYRACKEYLASHPEVTTCAQIP